jgi:hypothetical protein
MAEVAIERVSTGAAGLPTMSMWIPVLLVIASIVVALGRVVRQDGLGHRPPPASHADWFGQRR